MRTVKKFLEACAERYPSPRSSQHHCITVQDGVVVLTLMMGDHPCQSFHLSEEDLDSEPQALIEQIDALIKVLPAGPKSPIDVA